MDELLDIERRCYYVDSGGSLQLPEVNEPAPSYSDGQELPEVTDRFINFRLDFAFKYLLGSPECTGRLKALLNTILAGRIKIEEIEYLKTELLGSNVNMRHTVVDILCKEASGRVRIILEMQDRRQEHFIDRSILYTSVVNTVFAKKGADWNFDIDPVVIICLTNFSVRKESPECVQFASPMFHDQKGVGEKELPNLSKKNLYVYLELNKFEKNLEELETDLDLWFFLFKNLATLKEMPTIYDNELFRPIFEEAEYINLNDKNKMQYRMENHEHWMKNAELEGATAEGREEGREKGREEGRVEGRVEKSREFIKTLLDMSQFSAEQIAEMVKAPLSMVADIKNEIGRA